jgi:hypothetical protein
MYVLKIQPHCSLSSLSGPILSFCGDANRHPGQTVHSGLANPRSVVWLVKSRLACLMEVCWHMKNDGRRMIHDAQSLSRYLVLSLVYLSTLATDL